MPLSGPSSGNPWTGAALGSPLKRSPFGGGTEIEIRPVFEMEDFGAVVTPEIKERDQRLRAQLAGKK